jgi:hypothetical protein
MEFHFQQSYNRCMGTRTVICSGAGTMDLHWTQSPLKAPSNFEKIVSVTCCHIELFLQQVTR